MTGISPDVVMSRRSALVGAFISILACAALTSCGGGGDAASAPPPAALPASPALPPAASPASPAPPQATATCGLPDFATTALARVNQWRAIGANCGTSGTFGPAPALTWNDTLTLAATGHSQDMVTHNFFSHTGFNGSTLANRVDAVGYAWSGLGENIAAGQPSVDSVVDGWIASPGHCANIMNPSFVHMGLACVRGGAGNTYPTYWTMDLGQPR